MGVPLSVDEWDTLCVYDSLLLYIILQRIKKTILETVVHERDILYYLVKNKQNNLRESGT